ncbi:mu-type opioid receptor [Biomphalaria glabrata]|nr:mu-type opioid receptor-like [Biomphalaria glabrata]
MSTSQVTFSLSVIDDPMYISESKMTIFIIVVDIFVLGVFSVTGIVSNIINMIIFVKQVLKDSMTVGLFALSFTDFAIATLELTFSCTYLASVICPRSSVDLWILNYVILTWAIYAFYLISCWITAIISLERCFCVVYPFSVKRIFTRGRCVVVIIGVYAVHVAAVLPVYLIKKMEWVPLYPNSENGTIISGSPIWLYTMKSTEATRQLDTIMDITAGLFLFMTPQFIIFVCSIYMSVVLKKSSAVRSRKDVDDDSKPSTKYSNLTRQEKRLIKMVLFVDVLHSVCNVPRITVIVYYHLVFPSLNIAIVKNLSSVLLTCAVVLNTISCFSNSLGYYFLNSVYRKMFLDLFSAKKK